MATTRTWVAPPAGPRISYAWNNPHNWSPEGVPQADDNLVMTIGHMDISFAKLPAELHLGTGNTHLGTGGILLSTGPIMLNMVNGSATVGTVNNTTYLNYDQAHPLTFNASGTDHLTADNFAAVEGTINVAANSDLVVTGKMTFGYFGHLNGPGTVTNNGTISIADGDISAHVNGHGTLEMHNYHDGWGYQVITGAIDKGETVLLTGGDHGTRTELVNPKTFKASLTMTPPTPQDSYPSLLEIDGIHASEMNIRGDMLELSIARGPPLWSVREHMPAGVGASMQDTATGTQIAFGTPQQLLGYGTPQQLS